MNGDIENTHLEWEKVWYENALKVRGRGGVEVGGVWWYSQAAVSRGRYGRLWKRAAVRGVVHAASRPGDASVLEGRKEARKEGRKRVIRVRSPRVGREGAPPRPR